MKSVVLLTTEAEYVAVSDVVKEIKFLYQLLKSMEIQAPLPIKIRADSVGAIWLANNSGFQKEPSTLIQSSICKILCDGRSGHN